MLHAAAFTKGGDSMKRATLALIASLLCAASAPSQTEAEIRDRIVGTWKLVST